jgi:hypothetical protein
MDTSHARAVMARLAFQGLRLVWHLVWAGIALPAVPNLDNWLVTWVTPAASSVGYFAAAAGFHPHFRRDR